MARKRKVSESELFDYTNTSSDSEFSESNGKRPVARNAANARERARMRVLSKAFTRLKTSLPWVPADTKLSKLDTLRLASSYISHLRQILAEDQALPTTAIHPLNLTWPFTLHNRPPHHEESEQISTAAFTYIHQCPEHYQNERLLSMPYKTSATTSLYQTYEHEILETHNFR